MPDATPRPSLAASLACFRDGAVLIAKRGRAPNKGLWSLPGGGVAFGERAADAALREFEEETGARAESVGMADVVEVILTAPDGAPVRHAVILAFAGRLVSGEPGPSEEAEAVAWVRPENLTSYETTPGLAAVVARAAELLA
ncbi:NUDIX domain-containing protein [Methylopila sp. M107]|uniref:NUDIX hydrolase n=1 Tax=Methylopila sp. M107 TaxID=1101190 RepID=UPI0003A58A6A|nr:NUDIX domain-containing protein [Methylopila sp. M107]